ncbi:hypothetical protein [Paenibacillus methanolicus]|uniref:ABC-2 type transport system permease protein n=1 Tax=Paenibacillus methanolicus TaxID=582686 RepID=A0A5S5CFG6_9BACL|nr:hypothetical protein [Paenibacillus methanolicus]TYP78124.1 hypothetical protein BCM02_102701 [Paenibacillus methanolicus]
MNRSRILFHMMKADFLERTRRYSFLITVLVSVFIVYKFIPSGSDGYLSLSLHDVRGLYNSAWTGSAVAVLASMLLSLPAFYLVKDAVERDTRTGVGQILAATPMTRLLYTVGKMWSSFVLLLAIVGVLIVSALAMQLIRGEVRSVIVLELLLPFLYAAVPTMALVAALAILFESVPLLRKGLGNFVYFMVWIGLLRMSTSASRPIADMMGISPVLNDMSAEANAIAGQAGSDDHVFGFTPLKNELVTYDWRGVDWTVAMFAERYVWLLAAIGIAALASLFFHRFDEAKYASKRSRGRNKKSAKRKTAEREELAIPAKTTGEAGVRIKLTPYAGTASGTMLFRTLTMELRLMLKGLQVWWYGIALLFLVLGVSLPHEAVAEIIVPLTFVWPALIWSGMGTGEAQHRTQQLIFTAAHPIRNQFLALSLAGIIVSYLCGFGALVHFSIIGAWDNVLALLAGALFIPGLALALGIWSGSPKLFQVAYLLLWYIGPLNKLPELDFLGTTRQSLDQGGTWYVLAAAAVLYAVAAAGRLRQVHGSR